MPSRPAHRYVLIGASGYIGSAFARELTRRELPFLPFSRRDVDYYDVDALRDALRGARATFVINAAGYTGRPNVDACESHRAECLRANALLPATIGEACRDLRLPWGHVSSGCIYQGSRPGGAGFREHDPPNFCFRTDNCSYYSGAKALGEELLTDFPECYIWRVRLPFHSSHEPRNYLSKLLTYERLLDVRNSLTELHEFIDCCLRMTQLGLPFGTYHLTNGGSITTREITDILQRAGFAGRTFRFFEDEAEFMRLAAHTPRSSCVLDNSKALAAGLPLSEVHDAVARCARELAEWGGRSEEWGAGSEE